VGSGGPRRAARSTAVSRAALLAEATRALGGTLDLTRLIGRLIELTRANLAADAVGIWLLERDDSELVLRGDSGFKRPESVARLARAPGRDVLGWIVDRPGPVVVRGLSAAALPEARRWIEVEEFRAFLGVPLVGEAAALGMLGLFRRRRRNFTAADLALAETLCVPAAPAILNARLYAVALDNARLYEDAQRALSDLQVMQRRLVQGETLRALGELAGGAAHHLNNLLTIVVGRTQLLRRSVTEERVLRPLEIVERAAKDGAEVVRRLQQFAGMQRAPAERIVDLDQIVRDVLEMSRPFWQDSTRTEGADIVVESRLAPVPEIAGDPISLREMLTNLVLNAIDALPGGGRLTVETSATDRAVTLTVTDTGLGMSEDVRLRAHEPFFTTKGVRSTGLGLSVAFGIIRRHGGELAIQSEPGQGTTVRVTLPVPVRATRAASTAPPPSRPLRILLVDDEEEVRKALAEMLTAHGHTVLPANGGPEALRRLEADATIDLVVTDVVMPPMTGWELAAEVKARRPQLRVGVVTGLGELPDATPGMQAAVDFVLAKPVTIEALADTVSRLAPHER
jgi:signal transduction histidine kinase/CheY-like chemotaxis protein